MDVEKNPEVVKLVEADECLAAGTFVANPLSYVQSPVVGYMSNVKSVVSSISDSTATSQVESHKTSQKAMEVIGKLAEKAQTDETLRYLADKVMEIDRNNAKKNAGNNWAWKQIAITVVSALGGTLLLVQKIRNNNA